MGAMMVLIFAALVFYTLYEQTYGSWVTFTDRLLGKDLVPSLVVRDGTPWPWSIVALLLAPIAFMVAVVALRAESCVVRARSCCSWSPSSRCWSRLLRDALVLPQKRGLAHLPGRVVHRAAGAVVRGDLGLAGPARAGSIQTDEIRNGPAVRRTQLPAAGVGRAAGRRHRRDGQRVVAGAGLPDAGTGRDVPVSGRPVGGDAIVGTARGQPDDGNLVPGHRVFGNAGGVVRQARRDRSTRRRDDEHRRSRHKIRRPVHAADVAGHRLRRDRAAGVAACCGG